MRKEQKKQAEDFLELLGQAHDQIKQMIKDRNIPSALELLEDCQNGAISLGTLIEKAEGEGFSTISLLEEYCEQIYQLHTELAGEQVGDLHQTFKNLGLLLLKIENSVENDIPIRTEVVFLPYKASMWDSLESVWRAANEDPNCDAYVIPIPYYDKNPDGSFRERHYEGMDYPKDVPVVWYEDYDFAERRPDTIFIHNPYDECNYVTSVHPFFYSKNLKQFTDKLVYIPYFVLGEIDPEDEEAVKNISHFCTVPGVVYADKIVVQSENMRKVYIKALTNWLGEETVRELKFEDKVLGLGSPKMDKVAATRREDVEIPEEWQKLIQKSDGSSKKIILYNTSVNALLKQDEKMLEKIKDVLRIFKENQEEVALLWRPHPLIQATLESMRPELLQEYRAIVEQYRKEGWGIYDDTADLDRAIAISDAYYGDPSSLVQLYQKTGKSVMIQNVEIM